MSVNVRLVIEAVLKFIGWYVFRDSFKEARARRIEAINQEYISKVKEEMYKDE